MPPRRPAPSRQSSCQHALLTTMPSPASSAAGYVPYTPQQLFTARTGRYKHSPSDIPSAQDYPAPLALPGDCLLDDPKYPPQSFRSWLNLNGRNEVTQERRVVYVAAPPENGDISRWKSDEGRREEEHVSATSTQWWCWLCDMQ